MVDPLEAIRDPETKEQLLWLRTNYGTIVEAERLGRLVKGFKSQKGIYKPTGSFYALWVRQTLRGVYPDEDPQYSQMDRGLIDTLPKAETAASTWTLTRIRLSYGEWRTASQSA